MKAVTEETGASRGEPKRLFFIGSGSLEVSIEARNAHDRLYGMSLEGYFATVDYVFFPTDESRSYDLGRGFRVREISGKTSGRTGRVRRLINGAREITRWARERDPTVIGASDPYVSGLVAFIVAKIVRRPFYVVLLSAYKVSQEIGISALTFLPRWSNSLIESFCLRRADMVLTDREYYRRYATTRGASAQRVKIGPIRADAEYYDLVPDDSLVEALPERPFLVYVGRLSAEKHCLDLIPALATVHRDFESRHLLVFGSGPQHDMFLRSAADHGLQEFVHVRQGASRAELFTTMSVAGAVLATHGGYSLVEAALAAAPIVAYDYEWHAELIHHGETGLLAPFRDAHALGAQSIRLLQDRELASALGGRARRFVLEHHTPERAREEEIGHFERLLAGRH